VQSTTAIGHKSDQQNRRENKWGWRSYFSFPLGRFVLGGLLLMEQ